jgi:hypothetical protein
MYFETLILDYTPTPKNTVPPCYDMSKIKRELNFVGMDTSQKPNQTGNKINVLNQFNNPWNGKNGTSTKTSLKYLLQQDNKGAGAESKDDPIDNKINLENIVIGKDKRTILMIRNVPNKYTLVNLVDELNVNFMGKFDYVNLPVDYERKLNLGYAFINFLDPLHIIMFYETFYNKKWSRYRSDKKIDLNYAEKQGKKDATCKDENTYFANDDKKINLGKIAAKVEIPYVSDTFKFRNISPFLRKFTQIQCVLWTINVQ